MCFIRNRPGRVVANLSLRFNYRQIVNSNSTHRLAQVCLIVFRQGFR